MRKIIILFTAAGIFAACNNGDIETQKDVITTDTSGMYRSNVSTDTGAAVITSEEPAPVAEQPKVVTRTRTVYVDRPVKANTQKPVPQPVVTQPQTQANTGTGTKASESSGTGTNSPATGTTTPAPAEKDKGMSNSTKGAVIGGVGGAIGGAILSKKKGKGAIIGGVIGAAGGYILGKKKDKAQAADTTKN